MAPAHGNAPVGIGIIMPGFVCCLKMPAGFYTDALYPSTVWCPVLVCLFVSLMIVNKCLVFGRNALTSILGQGHPTYPVLDDTKKGGMAKRVRTIKDGDEYPGGRCVVSRASMVRKPNSQQAAWSLARH